MAHCSGGCCTPELPPGVRTEIVVADEGEAGAVAGEPAPTRRWAGIDAGGLDQVKLGTLWALLAGRELDDGLVGAFVPLHEVSEDGPWTFRVPDRLVELLARLDDGRAAPIAPAWASTDELAVDGWELESLAPVLDGLRLLARKARGESRALLMRVSLAP